MSDTNPTAPPASSGSNAGEKPARKKSDKTETQRRTIDTMRLILSGMTSAAIVQNTSAQWDITERQARQYVHKARVLIDEEFASDKAGLLAEHILHRRDLRKRATAAGDFRAELSAAQDEAKLRGLYPAEKVEHGGDGIVVRVIYEHERSESDTTNPAPGPATDTAGGPQV